MILKYLVSSLQQFCIQMVENEVTSTVHHVFSPCQYSKIHTNIQQRFPKQIQQQRRVLSLHVSKTHCINLHSFTPCNKVKLGSSILTLRCPMCTGPTLLFIYTCTFQLVSLLKPNSADPFSLHAPIAQLK